MPSYSIHSPLSSHTPLSIVILAGMRKLTAIFYVTAFLILLPEALRFVGIPSDAAANIRQMVYGLALILVVFQQANYKHEPLIKV